MKKYIIGFVLGAVLFSGSAVFAKALVEARWYQSEILPIIQPGTDGKRLYQQWGKIIKTFDEDTNVVCYLALEAGISCLKNN